MLTCPGASRGTVGPMVATDAPRPARSRSRLRPDRWLPASTLGTGAALLVAAGFAVDATGLEQDPYSWGYAFAGIAWAGMLTVPILMATGIALTSFPKTPRAARRCDLAGAVVTALCGVLAIGCAATVVWSEPPAGQLYCVAVVLVGVLWLLPPVVMLRRPVVDAPDPA
jgi:hypothetical protein